MPDPERLVRDFCAALERRDADEVLRYFTDDAVYHNVPLEPVTGHDGIREVLNLFLPAESFEVEMLNVAVRGDLVFTERIDRIRMGGKEVVLPVAGVFEVRGGKIAAWRDYFDLSTWQRQAG
jgi:limonene-1,2-epoxide hydrolase